MLALTNQLKHWLNSWKNSLKKTSNSFGINDFLRAVPFGCGFFYIVAKQLNKLHFQLETNHCFSEMFCQVLGFLYFRVSDIVVFENVMNNEIVIYKADDLTKVEVKVENETVWLNKEQISMLFQRDRSVISRHISNVFKENELQKDMVCAFFAHTTPHGAIPGKTQSQRVEYYNLDVIISVGYRVKSRQGTQFRIWANQILKDHLLKGYSLNNRMNRLEDDVHALKEKVSEIDFQIHTSLPPKQGVFFDGQVFDAHVLAGDIIRSAKSSIVIIDNYIDDSVLTLLSDKSAGVSVKVMTKSVSEKLKLARDKFNKQYGNLKIEIFNKSHDRFVIIDEKEVYHLGASLKDLGKKWFAFSKMDIGSIGILNAVDDFAKKQEEK
jgi:hypothetical protein